MRIVTQLQASDEDSYDEDNESDQEDDGDFMARCESLSYNLEIGELHERDKFSWIENRVQKKGANSLTEKKFRKLDFNFKLNHIKQVIKVEIYGIFRPRKKQKLPEGRQFYDKALFVGYFSFGRCVLKNGQYCRPNQVDIQKSKGIDVRLGLEEKAKKGGYRCVSLKVFDHKGGDFVENQELSMVVVDKRNEVVLAEVNTLVPLQQSPEGLFKQVEIGVNNYDPTMFMNQQFTIYFFQEDRD